MRISDWSSTCALPISRTGHREAAPQPAEDLDLGRARLLPGRRRGRRSALVFRRAWLGGDRKSVVSGKSGSVRVDSGGSRMIKRINTTIQIEYVTQYITTTYIDT